MSRLRRLSLAGVAASLAVLAGAAALADPHVGSHATRAVLAVDRSASVDAAMRATEARWIHEAGGDACVQPCRVVAFAAGAQALAPTVEPAVSAAGATDLQAGIAAAVGAAPRGGRVVVLSDGAQTVGDASRAVAAARARNVAVDSVRLTDGALRDAALTRLDAPPAVHQGDTVSLLVTVRSTAIAQALLYVRHDGGRETSQVVRLHAGDNPFTLSYTAAGAGWHSFRVRILMGGDRRPQNDSLSASVDVGAPPSVVVASVDARPEIARILTARGVRTTVESPAELPATAAAYGPLDAVVLDDVPADLLGKGQITALAEAVRGGGLGLLTLGGKHAYSLGGYARSPLNQVLPVASLVPGDLQRRNLAIELVLDRSGSMSDSSGGVRKITMAQSAARQTAQFVASHRDELGVVAFDIVPHQLISLQRVSPGASAKRVLSRIAGLKADGGTDIYLGLQAGLHQILASKSPNRHMILLTDGISQPHDYAGLLKQLAQHKISVATVALGSDVDTGLLRGIAAATGGNSYATKNPRDLPRIFVKETRLSAKPVQVDGRQQVLPQGSSPVVRSLAGQALPSISGNVVTRLRAGAQVDLIARSGSATTDPALAQWGYGTGRVVSWTPGLGAPWAVRWTGQTALWNDAVRWVARGVPSPVAAATADAGVSTRLDVDLAAAAPIPQTALSGVLERPGRHAKVTLEERSPSVYSADVASLPAGSYGLTLALPRALGGSRRVLVDVPYPAEYAPAQFGRAVLGQVAAQTGGRLLVGGDTEAITGDGRSLRVPLLSAALALYAVSIGARLIVRRR